VTVAITGCVWYVNNNDAQGNSGTSEKPFDTTAQAQTASGNNQTTFVYDGDDTTTGYNTGYAMNTGESLLSEGATLTIGSDTLHTADAANKASITNNNADVVTLAGGATVKSFNIDPQGTGGGIFGGVGDAGGTIDDVRVIDAGTAGTGPGLELNGTSGTWNISDLTVQSVSGATGVQLLNAGTTNFLSAGTISVSSAGGKALGATGTNLGAGSVFDDLTSTGSNAGGVSLVNTTGTTTLGNGAGTDLALTTASGASPALEIVGGNVSVPGGGTANLDATGGPAADITNTTGSFDLDTVSSMSSANDGINIDGIGSGSFTATGGSISGAAGISFDLNGGSGTVTYPGTFGNGAGTTAIDITNRSGGAATFAGAVNDTGDAGGGINLASNGGSTIAFQGALALSTGASPAFAATGGGTVTATASGSVLASTTGTTLQVSNTNIGAADLTFRSVSSAGAASGIVLNNTGNSGGLSVTGDGGATANHSGGQILNSVGPGISLNSTTDVSLAYLDVNSGLDDGIHGEGLNGFTLNRSNVLSNGNSTSDDGIQLGLESGATSITGPIAITSSTVNASAHNNVHMRSTSGTMSSLTVTGSTFNNLNDTTGANSFLFEASGTSSVTTATLSGDTFGNNSPQRGLEIQSHDTASVSGFTVQSNTFSDNGIGVSFTQDTASSLAFKLLNNTMTDPQVPTAGSTLGQYLQQVNVFSSSQSTGGAIQGRISGNTIGTAGVPNSGSPSGPGVRLLIQGKAQGVFLLDNNTIRETGTQSGSRGIDAQFLGVPTPCSGPVPTSSITVTNNNVDTQAPGSTFPLAAIYVAGDNQGCGGITQADIHGNTVPSSGSWDFPTFDGVGGAQLIFDEVAGAPGGDSRLVGAAATAQAQLANTNTGKVSAPAGVQIIAGPIGTPP
jgi:hypothetical protein